MTENYTLKPFHSNLKLLLANRNVTQGELAKMLNVTSQAVSGWVKGHYPTAEKLFKLADYFQISLDDLVYTDLYSSHGKRVVTDRPTRYLSEKGNVELINIEVQAGHGEDPQDWPEVIDRINLPFLPEKSKAGMPFKAFKLRGDSMEPTASAGDYIICERVDDASMFINDLLYLVIFKRSGLAFKQVRKIKDSGSNDFGSFELISHNRTYGAEIVPAEEVEEMYRVVKVMKLKEY